MLSGSPIPFVADYRYVIHLRRNTSCHKCGEEIKEGDMIIRGGSKGTTKNWHENCYHEY